MPKKKKPEFADLDTEFDLADCYDEEKPIRCKMYVNPRAIGIQFEGYEDYHGAENVLIEFDGKHPRVVIWGDINSEDPTHIISLEGAKEDMRVVEEEPPCLCGRGECPECGEDWVRRKKS